jgi:transglutaminase-like putative cysteine protease
LRLLLPSSEGQFVAHSEIDVAPTPDQWNERADIFGNRVVRMRIETPHRELIIRSSARVEVRRPPPPAPGLTPAWETVARDVTASASLGADSPAFALYGSRLVTVFEAATAYARESFPARRPIYEAAIELNARIKADFKYDSKATAVTTAPADAFAKRGGVCQDFAHIMIAIAREWGIPARYVSGYLYHRRKGQDRSGEDATHAWVEAYLPSLGWVGFDPTNDIQAGERHIRVAVGRDYADVPPTRGTFKGGAESELAIALSVEPTQAPVRHEEFLRVARPLKPAVASTSTAERLYHQQQQQQQ